MTIKKLGILIIFACTFQLTFSQGSQTSPNPTFGQQNNPEEGINPITTAVPFLLIAADSRASGMGDIGVCTSADANSQHHNPAKTVFNKSKFGISFSYSPWLRNLGVNDIHLTHLSTFWKITDMDAIGFSLRYFSLGNIQFTDAYGNPTNSVRPNEFALDFTYSRKLTDVLSMAITPRFIFSRLTDGGEYNGDETKAGLAGAADISLFYEQDFRAKGLYNSTLRFGLNISNMGNKISYSSQANKGNFLPCNLKLGLSYNMEFDEYNQLSLNGEINKLLVPTPPIYFKDSFDLQNNRVIEYGKDDNVSVAMGMIQSFYDAPNGFKEEMQEIAWALGLEYSYRNLLFVRAGYFNENYRKGNRKYITFGAGIHYSIFAIDVSYLFTVDQHHPLENTLRFTLSFDLESFNKEEIQKQGRINNKFKGSGAAPATDRL